MTVKQTYDDIGDCSELYVLGCQSCPGNTSYLGGTIVTQVGIIRGPSSIEDAGSIAKLGSLTRLVNSYTSNVSVLRDLGKQCTRTSSQKTYQEVQDKLKQDIATLVEQHTDFADDTVLSLTVKEKAYLESFVEAHRRGTSCSLHQSRARGGKFWDKKSTSGELKQITEGGKSDSD